MKINKLRLARIFAIANIGGEHVLDKAVREFKFRKNKNYDPLESAEQFFFEDLCEVDTEKTANSILNGEIKMWKRNLKNKSEKQILKIWKKEIERWKVLLNPKR